MAKQVKTEQDSSTTQGIKKSYLVSKLMPRVRSAQAEIDDKRSVLSELVKESVEDHNLHPGAFRMLKALDRIHKKDPAKFVEQWYHLNLYVEHMGWTTEQPDMLPDRQPPAGEGDEHPGSDADNGTEYLRSLKPLETVADNDDDLRPRHLRAGGGDFDPNLN